RRPGPGGTDDGISERIHGRPSSAGLLSAYGTGDGVRGVAPGRAPPRHALAQKPHEPAACSRRRLDVAPVKEPQRNATQLSQGSTVAIATKLFLVLGALVPGALSMAATP
ncbi:MAG: hypothetical protein ACK56I_26635, partial [bacterium]